MVNGLLTGVLCFFIFIQCAVGALSAASTVPPAPHVVTAYGAVGDGKTRDSPAIQRSVDACADGGGGTVYFPPGVYLSGSIRLKSGVRLWLDPGATILGSPSDDDYDPYETIDFPNDADRETSFFHFSLIWAEDADRVGILGGGTIDSNRERRGGPKSIALKRCKFVEIRDVTIRNAPNYAVSLLGTDYVNIDGVMILNAHSDGIDPDASRHVRIANCHIVSWDDAIVLKSSFSLGGRRSTEDVSVTNCYLESACSTFKLGTESGGDFKRIVLSNCVMKGLQGGEQASQGRYRPANAGLGIMTVDGAHIDGVSVSNVVMHDIRAPIFIRLGNRGRDMPSPVPGTLKNVNIDNIIATNATLASSITGIPGHPVEGVSLSNVRFTYTGGSTYKPADEAVPEVEGAYPESRMFGGLPAYGLYVRHIKDLTLNNVQLLYAEDFWRLEADDYRNVSWDPSSLHPTPAGPGVPGHAIVMDNVAGIRVTGLHALASPDGAAVLHFVNVRDAFLSGTVAAPDTQVFLEVAGDRTQAIHLTACDLTRANRGVHRGPEVPETALALNGILSRP